MGFFSQIGGAKLAQKPPKNAPEFARATPWNPASRAPPDPRFDLGSFPDVLKHVFKFGFLEHLSSCYVSFFSLKRTIFCCYIDLQYQQLFCVWNTDFNPFLMPSTLYIKTSFQVTPFSPSPRHPSRGSLLLFRRSKMAGATATFSRDICRGERAPERQEFPPNIAK